MNDIFLYNTQTRKKEVLSPLKKGNISLYTCGPTVYNFAHIGNFRTYIFEDILKRTLFLSGYAVNHIMNITDVGHLVSDADEGEDKMELSSKKEGKSAFEIASFYTKAFFDDFNALNCIMPNLQCKATEHIKEMIELIKKLETKGFTYKISDGIYFDTSKFKNFGLLAGEKHIKGLKKGARIEFKDKKNLTDFALWKFSPKNSTRQMEWASPWGTGFPGWHIECSAMAMKYLGETIDIHCGGEDHIAVHHTNESAQSEAVTGKPFAKFWLHGKFLVLKDSVKMSKSGNNFITVKTLKDKGYNPLAYRYLCLGAHYRTQLVFDWDTLNFAEVSLNKLRSLTAKIKGNLKPEDVKEAPKEYKQKFLSTLQDDLNTPKALAVIWQVLRDKNISAEEKFSFMKYADKALGLDITAEQKKEKLSPEITDLIKQREEARKNKDYKASDDLRDKLLALGVEIKDTPQGTEWILKK